MLLLFFVLPLVISLILVFEFSAMLDYKVIKNIISVSGYGFTFSSLILVFILYRSFKPSDYNKSVSVQKYLEEVAIEELGSSLGTIKTCIRENEVKGLAESSNTVAHIHGSLKEYEDDVILKAYSNHIKSLFNLINKHGLPSIGLKRDYKKLQKISDNNKSKIWRAADDLQRYLDRM